MDAEMERLTKRGGFGLWQKALAMSFAVLFFAAFTALASAATIYVPDNFSTIQQAVDNATAGDTIIVRDGTYNETVDVTKSHLTIRSESGPSVTTVSASLNPDDHVFKISDQTNVTLQGFEIRDAHSSMTRSVAGIYMYNASECNISDNVVTNILTSGKHKAYGIYLSSSSGNSFHTTTVYNLSCREDGTYGIRLWSSSNNSFDTSTVYNLHTTTQGDAYGIHLWSSSNNSFHTTTVYNLSARDYAYGIYLHSSSNNNSFDTSTVYNLSAVAAAYGIRLYSSSDNSFSSGSISDINAPIWWDFYSEENAHGNSAREITISSFPTTISFTYENGIWLKSVATPPADPAGKQNISKYVNVTEVTADSWIFMNVSYEEGDLGGVVENSLRMWKHNGTDWTEVPGTNGVNTVENYVYANITEFGSIFAPLGNTSGPPVNCTCGDICVNPTGWWRDGGAFNPSNTPIQHAIDNATAGDTICVKDGTYNENVDVTKSNLTIRSENGSSVTTVSASLSPDEHVFNISDQTNVTLEGFTIRDAYGANKDVAGIYMKNASECKISDNVVTNISATGFNYVCGIWLSASDNNIFKSISMPGGISSGGAACGLSLENSNKKSFTGTTIKNVAGFLATGISFGSLNPAGGDPIPGFSNYNTFTGTTIKNVAGSAMAEGIFLFASNNNTFDPTVIENVGGIEDQSVVSGVFLLASNDTSFTDTVIENVEGIGDQSEASGVFLFASNDTSFTDTTIKNVAGFLATGISFGTLDPAGGAPIPSFSNYNTFTDTTISNVAGFLATGISFGALDPAGGAPIPGFSNYNTFTGTTIRDVKGNMTVVGIFLFASNDNTFHTSTVYNLSGDVITLGIFLGESSDNSFCSGSISDINAPTWWDFYSDEYAHGNSAEDITISSFPTTISFTYDNGIWLKSVATPPADPADKRNIGKYVNVTEVTADSWIFMNVSYEDGDLGGVDENSLRLWKHNGTDWTEVPGTNGVNTAENYVYANITEFNATATNVIVTETYDGNVTFVSAVPASLPGNDTWKFTSLNVSETK
jgi:parallel beta-helix repeat protein